MGKRYYVLVLAVMLVLLVFPLVASNDVPLGSTSEEPLRPDSILTPYMFADNVTSIHQAYSTTADCPWGSIHEALDIFAVNGSSFQAVADGEIFDKEKHYNSINGYWQVGVTLKYNSSVEIRYAFEPDGQEADADVQLSMIPHQIGDSLQQGDFLGNFLALDQWAHVHWEIAIGNVKVCPEPYFTPVARQSVLDIIHQTNATWQMCYCGTDPCPTGSVITNGQESPGFEVLLVVVVFTSLCVLRRKNQQKPER